MQKVEFYIPSRSKSGIDLTDLQTYESNAIAEKLTNMYGGASMREEIGFYKDKHGYLVTEKILVVYSYFEPTEVSTGALTYLAKEIKKSMMQESFMLVIDNNPIFL